MKMMMKTVQKRILMMFQSVEIAADEKTEPAQRKCTECDFTAPTKGKLNEHYTEGHGGKKYKCNKHKKVIMIRMQLRK